MRWVWPYLVLAGCYSDRALEIIVQDPDGLGVTQVELYIGRSATGGMEPLPFVSHVQPKDGAFDTTVWWSRLDPPDDVMGYPSDVEPMGPDGAIYQIFPSPDADVDNVLASVVAVGYAADRTPLGVGVVLGTMKVPTEGKSQYRIHLLPHGSIDSGSDRPGLRLWGGDRGQACVQVDGVPGLTDHDPAASAMIVRDGDLDCDGYGDTDPRECFPDRYLAQASIPRDSLACAFTRPITSNGESGCVVGGETCADGSGTTPGVCSPSSYCMMTPSCSSCTAASPCDPHRAGTMLNPYIECTVFYEGTMAPQFCSNVPAQLQLDELLPTLDLECDLARGAKMRKGAPSMWMNTVQITTAATPNVVGALEIKPTAAPPGDHSCDFDLAPRGPVPSASGGNPLGEFNTTLSVPLTGPATGRGLLVPLHLKILIASAGCDDATTVLGGCKIVPTTAVPDPVLGECLRATPDPDTVVLD